VIQAALPGVATAAQSSGSKLPRHKKPTSVTDEIQATLAFNALRNATNNFTMSCGFIGCSTFASAMFSSL